MNAVPTAALRRTALSLALTSGLALSLAACGGESAASSSSTGTSGATEPPISPVFGDVTTPASPERVVPLAEPALDVALAVGIPPVGTTASRGGTSAPAYLGDGA